MHFLPDFSLKDFNTFGIDVKARLFAQVSTEEELLKTLAYSDQAGCELFTLGGGSNVLFMGDIDRLVVQNRIGEVVVLSQTSDEVLVRAGGGVVWHSFVQFAVSKGWGGVENLSLIPGTVGAAPLQNIGAYGVEIKDVMDSLEAIHVKTGQKRTFLANECRFGYRDSVFKNELKGEWIITSVVFKLYKHGTVHTAYGDIQQVLSTMGIVNPGIADVSRAVIQIRQSKLPDPAVIGNAGSFFKNPEVSSDFFAALKQRFPGVPGYPLEAGVKVPAGWLIEQAGWRGFRRGSVGVHERQALVLVNYGQADGGQVKELAEEIQDSVNAKFGIFLTPEVNYI